MADKTEQGILDELVAIGQKVTSLESEIRDKEIELSELRKSNAQLLAKNISKERRPQGLKVQMRQIEELETEINQLKDAVPILRQRESELAGEHVVAKAQRKIDENYRPKAESFSKKIEKIFRLLNDTKKNMGELEDLISQAREGNPLPELNGIFRKLENRIQFDALGFPEDELDRYCLLDRITPLEKTLNRFPQVVRDFSDLCWGVQMNQIGKLKIPKQQQGAVSVGGGTYGYVVGDDVETKKLNRVLGLG